MSLGEYKPSTGWVTLDHLHLVEDELAQTRYIAARWESICLSMQKEAAWAGWFAGFLVGIAGTELFHMMFV